MSLKIPSESKKVSKVDLKKVGVPTVVVSPSSPFMTLEIVISFL